MLKWAFYPILGAKRPPPIWDKTPGNGAKLSLWGKNAQYGIINHHFSIIMGKMINNNYPFGYI